MLRAVYDWTIEKARHRHAAAWLGGVSFAESSFFPVPPDALLLPMTFARPERWWVLALVCSVTSVVGGIAGYLIGWLLYDSVGVAILDFYGYKDKFDAFAALYNEWGLWIVFAAGLTPLPYKVFTIASGVTGLSLPLFILGSVLSRSLRFFAVAALARWMGPPVRRFVEARLGLVFTVSVAVLLGGFVALRYLF